MKIDRLLYVTLLCGLISSCETDDVDESLGGPEITMTTGASAISENGGTSTVSFNLSESATDVIVVDISFGGTATGGGVDYTVDADVVTFSPGEIVKNITLTAVQDTIEEGNENIEVRIANASNARFDANAVATVVIEDDDVPLESQLLLNEILYDPAAGDDGDANGDGTRDPLEDEFLELVNHSTQDLDLSGYKVYDTSALDDGTPRHVFPSGTILSPGKALVLFGGGTPTGSFGNATVQTASGGQLNLTNAGDLVTISDASDEVVLTFDIEPLSNNPDEAYTRNPDLTGDFVQHASVNGELFSPGTKTDGSQF